MSRYPLEEGELRWAQHRTVVRSAGVAKAQAAERRKQALREQELRILRLRERNEREDARRRQR